MKLVVQRVSNASVEVDGEMISKIGNRFLVLLGIAKGDKEEDADRLAKKLCALRIFPDENGKTNKSLREVGGELLIISQFTLIADTSGGNRPSFFEAMPPQPAEAMYDYFCKQCEEYAEKVSKGVFGADMKVALTNQGPFTIVLE